MQRSGSLSGSACIEKIDLDISAMLCSHNDWHCRIYEVDTAKKGQSGCVAIRVQTSLLTVLCIFRLDSR